MIRGPNPAGIDAAGWPIPFHGDAHAVAFDWYSDRARPLFATSVVSGGGPAVIGVNTTSARSKMRFMRLASLASFRRALLSQRRGHQPPMVAKRRVLRSRRC